MCICAQNCTKFSIMRTHNSKVGISAFRWHPKERRFHEKQQYKTPPLSRARVRVRAVPRSAGKRADSTRSFRVGEAGAVCPRRRETSLGLQPSVSTQVCPLGGQRTWAEIPTLPSQGACPSSGIRALQDLVSCRLGLPCLWRPSSLALHLLSLDTLSNSRSLLSDKSK